MIIVAFDFRTKCARPKKKVNRTKCAVTDRIETAYIVDDLQLLLFEPNDVHARVGNTCIYFKPGNTVRGGTQFPRELSPVNWFCTTRELGPGDRIP